MIDLNIIKAKLNTIRDNMLRIKKILELSDSEIKKDVNLSSALERFFQLLVDAAVSINEHIISEENLEVPSDYFGTFLILGKTNVLPLEFAQKIAPSVGLRNQVVHQYEKVNIDVMLSSIRNDVHQYDDYMALIIKRYNLVD